MSREDFDTSLILVNDIMSKAIISVNVETTVFQVAKMMEQGGIGAVLVRKMIILLVLLLIEILQQKSYLIIFHLIPP